MSLDGDLTYEFSHLVLNATLMTEALKEHSRMVLMTCTFKSQTAYHSNLALSALSLMKVKRAKSQSRALKSLMWNLPLIIQVL